MAPTSRRRRWPRAHRQRRSPQPSDRTGDLYDPATGTLSGTVDFASVQVVEQAVEAARAAFADWGATSLTRRTQVLFAFRELLNQRAGGARRDHHRRARQGPVRRPGRGDPRPRGGRVRVRHPAPAQGGLLGEGSPPASTYTPMRKPLGVVGIISPFNFPAMVPMWFYPIAIASGNTVIVKPSEKDPSPANFVAELWREAGLPDGRVQRRARGPGGGRRAADPPGREGDLVRRLDRRSPSTSTRPGPATASASRPSAGRRTTWWSCPTRTSTSRPTPP